MGNSGKGVCCCSVLPGLRWEGAEALAESGRRSAGTVRGALCMASPGGLGFHEEMLRLSDL